MVYEWECHLLELKNPRLTAHGMSLKNEFVHLYAKEGCQCKPDSPIKCRHCMHPGHPEMMQYDVASWEATPDPTKADRIMEAIRELAGRGNT